MTGVYLTFRSTKRSSGVTRIRNERPQRPIGQSLVNQVPSRHTLTPLGKTTPLSTLWWTNTTKKQKQKPLRLVVDLTVHFFNVGSLDIQRRSRLYLSEIRQPWPGGDFYSTPPPPTTIVTDYSPGHNLPPPTISSLKSLWGSVRKGVPLEQRSHCIGYKRWLFIKSLKDGKDYWLFT